MWEMMLQCMTVMIQVVLFNVNCWDWSRGYYDTCPTFNAIMSRLATAWGPKTFDNAMASTPNFYTVNGVFGGTFVLNHILRYLRLWAAVLRHVLLAMNRFDLIWSDQIKITIWWWWWWWWWCWWRCRWWYIQLCKRSHRMKHHGELPRMKPM